MTAVTTHRPRSPVRPAPRQLVLPLTAVLATVTAVVLASTAFVMPLPAVPSDQSEATAAVVRRFYAAANTAIASGDAAALTLLLGGDAGQSTGQIDDPPGSDNLARRLVAIHDVQPSLRLQVEEMVADGHGAVARVTLVGESSVPPLVRATATGDGRLLDGFRVQDDQVVEHWGATASLAAPAAVIVANVRSPATRMARVGVARLTLAPGSEIPTLVGIGPIALAVETGAVLIQPNPTRRLNRATPESDLASRPVERDTERTLAPGDQLVVRAGAAIGLRNGGALKSVLLAVAIFPPSTADPVQLGNGGTAARSSVASRVSVLDDLARETRWPEGVNVQQISAGQVPMPEGDRLKVTAARAVLGPVTEVRGVALPTMLLAVEEGTLVSESSGDGGDAASVLTTGETLIVPAGSAVRIHGVAEKPVAVLLLFIEPVFHGTDRQ